jgi:hypothetical protein
MLLGSKALQEGRSGVRRRISIIAAAVACIALAIAAPASAQDPSIVTDITFGQGAPFGTFTAEEPLCPVGTFVDDDIGGGGAFRSGHVFYHGITVRKTLTCADGSGTFTILFHPQFTPATPAACEEAGPFSVVGGTGAYTRLRGNGDFCVFPDGDGFTETFTGTFRL